MLAEKISGTHVGLWLLVPEHIRLGSWDLLQSWSGIHDAKALEPRLGFQMVHEAALCVNGVRQRMGIRQKGFETANGLPFVATDQTIHQLLNHHTVQEAISLQVALSKIRAVRNHYLGKIVLIDPRRIATWSKRQMPPKKSRSSDKARKVVQTFFAIDATSGQPFGFTLASSTLTVSQATLPLIDRIGTILSDEALLLADGEHFTVDILTYLKNHPTFKFLIPAPRHKSLLKKFSAMTFKSLWAGYAVAEGSYTLKDLKEPMRLIVQRTGERENDYEYKPFVTSSTIAADELMTFIFPERWNIEEFFNVESALGWNRASTLNLNIRCGKLSMALLAQAAIYQLRQKLPSRMKNWTVESIAQNLFSGIDGDLRVKDDTIIATLYNAPEEAAFRENYEHLPQKLVAQGLDPRIPWLYNFKLDFRFK